MGHNIYIVTRYKSVREAGCGNPGRGSALFRHGDGDRDLNATQVLKVTGAAGLADFRPALTDLGLVFWSVATGLIPALAVLGAARWRRGWRPEGSAASCG
jgi:hypothetical protein